MMPDETYTRPHHEARLSGMVSGSGSQYPAKFCEVWGISSREYMIQSDESGVVDDETRSVW